MVPGNELKIWLLNLIYIIEEIEKLLNYFFCLFDTPCGHSITVLLDYGQCDTVYQIQ